MLNRFSKYLFNEFLFEFKKKMYVMLKYIFGVILKLLN